MIKDLRVDVLQEDALESQTNLHQSWCRGTNHKLRPLNLLTFSLAEIKSSHDASAPTNTRTGRAHCGGKRRGGA